MSISEQVKELRRYVETYEKQPFGREVEGTVKVLSDAADTIESLSAKLEEANMERSAENRKIDQIRKMSTEELARLMVFSDNGCWYSNLTDGRHWEKQDKAVNALVEFLESKILENCHEP